MALSPTGRFIAINGPDTATTGDSASRTINIYELATGRQTRIITVEEAVHQVIWSPDERFLAYIPSATDDPFDLAVIDLASGKRSVIVDLPNLILRPSWARDPPLP